MTQQLSNCGLLWPCHQTGSSAQEMQVKVAAATRPYSAVCRNTICCAADFVDDSCSQPSQSQLSQPDRGTSVHLAVCCTSHSCLAFADLYHAGNSFMNLSNGAFPVPQCRKVLRKRYQSPPCLRNTFLHGQEDAAPLLPRAPPPASRYRCDADQYRRSNWHGHAVFLGMQHVHCVLRFQQDTHNPLVQG